MTHIPGHIDSEASSFGVIKPVNITYAAKDKISSLAAVPFSILYAPPAYPELLKDRQIKSEALTPDHVGLLVGFHPYIIPWGDGKKVLIIASDVQDWKDHTDAEKEVQSDKPIEQLNDDKGLELIREARDRIKGRTGPAAKPRDKAMAQVLDNSIRYIRSTSFQTIYLGDKPRNGEKPMPCKGTDEVIKWIQENGVPLDQVGFEVKDHVLKYIAKRSLN